MDFIQNYGKELFSLSVPVLTWILNTFFKARAKLQIAVPHTFTFLVQQPLYDEHGTMTQSSQTMTTTSLVLINAGKETATKVELVFNWKPLCLNVWPSRHFTELTESDNRYIIIFDSLAPSEHIGCELFSINSELPELITVRSDQCVAEFINMAPQPVIPIWLRRVGILLLLSGIALVTYVSILLLQFLVLKTPLGH